MKRVRTNKGLGDALEEVGGVLYPHRERERESRQRMCKVLKREERVIRLQAAEANRV